MAKRRSKSHVTLVEGLTMPVTLQAIDAWGNPAGDPIKLEIGVISVPESPDPLLGETLSIYKGRKKLASFNIVKRLPVSYDKQLTDLGGKLNWKNIEPR